VTTESQRLGDALRRAGANVALLTRFEDVCYATGYEVPPPIDAGAAFAWGPTVALADAAGQTCLLVPAAYTARAAEMSRADETVLVPGFGHFEPVEGEAEFVRAVQTALRGLGVDRSAVVAVDRGSLPIVALELLDGARVVDVRPITAQARRIKTDREIELLRAAAAAADVGQDGLRELARPGVNELTLMGGVLTLVERHAGQPIPWAGELVSGPRTGVLRYPGGPVDRDVEAGDTVLMDLSIRRRGYWADCTNTFVCGTPSAAQRRYYRAARDAFDAAVDELRPGRRARDAHAAAAAAFAKHGLEPAHYTGHQLGTSVNEEPRLVRYDGNEIEAGMVFAVEPGAYGGPDAATGARAEKVVLVTETGPEILSRFEWGMDG
jgi:Xaa-Pro aminopeptidase